MTSAPLVGGPAGVTTDYAECRAINRRGNTINKGELVQFDTTVSATESTGFVAAGTALTSGEFDAEADGLSAVVQPFDTRAGIFGIALESIEDNKPGRILLMGRTEALVQANAGGTPLTDVEAGTVVGVAASVDYLHFGAANTSKALAYTLDFITDETVATRIPVFFNGVNGIGTP